MLFFAKFGSIISRAKKTATIVYCLIAFNSEFAKQKIIIIYKPILTKKLYNLHSQKLDLRFIKTKCLLYVFWLFSWFCTWCTRHLFIHVPICTCVLVVLNFRWLQMLLLLFLRSWKPLLQLSRCLKWTPVPSTNYWLPSMNAQSKSSYALKSFK